MADWHITPGFLISAATIFPVLGTGLIGLRFYARKVNGNAFGIDDYLMLPALALLIGMVAAILRGIALKSVAYPAPLLAPDKALTSSSPQEVRVRQIFIVTELTQVILLGILKCSAMFFYRRIFNVGIRYFNVLSIATIVLVVIWSITFFFGLLFECGYHVDWQYESISTQQRCTVQQSGIQHTFIVTDVFTDLLVLLFPLPIVLRLKMSIQRKLGMVVVFLVGASVIMASLARMVVYISLLDAEASKAPPDPDLYVSVALYFMLLEAGMGLCAVCLPSLYGLAASKGLRTLMWSFRSRFSGNRLSDSDERSVGLDEFSKKVAYAGTPANVDTINPQSQ